MTGLGLCKAFPVELSNLSCFVMLGPYPYIYRAMRRLEPSQRGFDRCLFRSGHRLELVDAAVRH
jgi:hypothetical protein